ncbi:hypothetical protein UXN79_25010, partial [Enterobacter kobei]|uniref:hypothetical protein n=1 Tax=Enterobacter kobei TaxID=208224 RepID=UPI002FD4BA88
HTTLNKNQPIPHTIIPTMVIAEDMRTWSMASFESGWRCSFFVSELIAMPSRNIPTNHKAYIFKPNSKSLINPLGLIAANGTVNTRLLR